MLIMLETYDVAQRVDTYALVPVYTVELAGFPVVLSQYKSHSGLYAVQYGKQLDYRLSYTAAAAKLGQAIMHASALIGTLRD